MYKSSPTSMIYWLVVHLPLGKKKIWKSVGIMTFPSEWKNKTCSKPPTSLLWGSPTWGGGWLNLYVKRPNPSYPSNLKLTYADSQNMHHSYGHWLVITCYNWLFLWDINNFYGVIAVTYNWYDSGRNLQLKKKPCRYKVVQGDLRGFLLRPHEDYSSIMWVCLKIVYIPNCSHLIGIMIINHWV